MNIYMYQDSWMLYIEMSQDRWMMNKGSFFYMFI